MVIGTKKEIYSKEQYNILLKLIKIIGLSQPISQLEKSDIEKNEIISQISEMKNDIYNFFKTGVWPGTKKGLNIELNMLKNIFKYFGIEIISIERKKKDENNYYKSYRIYKFIIPENIINDLI
jgi:hypothetical protein